VSQPRRGGCWLIGDPLDQQIVPQSLSRASPAIARPFSRCAEFFAQAAGLVGEGGTPG
jgi:hypothetical protein